MTPKRFYFALLVITCIMVSVPTGYMTRAHIENDFLAWIAQIAISVVQVVFATQVQRARDAWKASE